jgi:hypothetical protein
VIPWRRLGGPPLPDEVGPAVRWRILGVVAVLLAWHTACVVKTRNYYPILNWGVFGWVQPAFDGPIEVYRLGYRDPSDGEIRPIPHDVGGFMEGRYVGRTRMMAKEYLTEHDPDNRALVLRKIRVLLDGMRPYQSNRWLLGNLALPTHGICIQDPPRATPDCPFFALRGEAEYVDGVVTFQWLDVEPLDFPPP